MLPQELPDGAGEGGWTGRFEQHQRAAEARLEKLEEERRKKEFWDDYRRREDRLHRLQSKASGENVDFLTRTLTKVGFFRKSATDRASGPNGWRGPNNVRRAVFGSTDGFSVGLSAAHEPVPSRTLKAAFREIDRDQDGLVSAPEIVRALRRCGVNASRRNVERIMQDCGYDSTGLISVDQFISFFRATERLSRTLRDDYDPASACCTCCMRFMFFLLLLAMLIVVILLLGEEEGSVLWVTLLIVLGALGASFGLLMIPVICVPLMHAVEQGKRNREIEQERIRRIEVAPKVAEIRRARSEPPMRKDTITWLEDALGGRPADTDKRGGPRGEEGQEGYDPKLYRLAQNSASRQGSQHGRRGAPTRAATAGGSIGGVFSSEALGSKLRMPASVHDRAPLPAVWSGRAGEASVEMPEVAQVLRAELRRGESPGRAHGQKSSRPSSQAPSARRGSSRGKQARKPGERTDWVVLDCE